MKELAYSGAFARRRPDTRLERRLLPDLEHSPSLCRSRGRLRHCGDLGRLRDLPDNLDDVPVCVEDVELPVGAVATPQDLVDAFQLLLRAEVAGVRTQRLQRPPYEGGDGDAVAASRVQVHQRRGEPVARGEPLVLGREDAVERRDLLAELDELGVMLAERLA